MMMSRDKNINSGKVLLAQPFMLDTNFKEAAVLLCEHNDDGSLGFIMNKPLNMEIEGLISNFPEFSAEVYFRFQDAIWKVQR